VGHHDLTAVFGELVAEHKGQAFKSDSAIKQVGQFAACTFLPQTLETCEDLHFGPACFHFRAHVLLEHNTHAKVAIPAEENICLS